KTIRAEESFLNSRVRREVFELIAEARTSSMGKEASERERIAANLEAEAQSRGLDDDVDLGFTAAISDLRQTVRGRSDTQKVDPNRTALINWDPDPAWRPTFYQMEVKNFSATEESVSPAEAPAIQTVTHGPFVLPFAVAPSPGRTLTVLFQG